MRNPFPGMNPYLENSELWHQVHNHLIAGIALTIANQIAPQYRVSIEQRCYQSFDDPQSLVGITDVGIKPDDWSADRPIESAGAVSTLIKPQRVRIPVPWEVKERYLEVREVATKELITVIEILSPVNKRSGKGRSLYEAKRTKILTSFTNLIEIDLLRSGQPMAMMGASRSDYRILVSRSGDRPHADLFRFDLKEAIPNFPLPLRPESAEVMVDLQSVLNDIYDRARLDLSIDYSQDPWPEVAEESLVWMRELLKP